jgi:hypothetical protein
MVKVIWSAIALSLIFGPITAQSTDFLSEEIAKEITPELDGPQKFTPPDLFQKNDWNVKPHQVEIDKEPLKGQLHSLIPWSTQDPEVWLDINHWLYERSLKDKTPDWKLRLRDERHSELIGKFLKCHGKCSIFRGTTSASGQHLSRVLEGDEVHTGPDSVAWIYLMDGSLLRLGPESSLSFQEINFSAVEVFVLLRLNQGHTFWHPRKKGEYPKEINPETDAVALPLLVREANREYFARQIFSRQGDSERLSEILELDENSHLEQIKKLNELKSQHDDKVLPTKVMLVTPNFTIEGSQTSFDAIYLPGGKGYFKKRETQVGEEFTLHLRGYKIIEAIPLAELNWHEVDALGRSFDVLKNPPGELTVLELLTSRIKSLELAREWWLQKYSIDIYGSLSNPRKLAMDHGYSLWGEERKQRLNYLVEYTRRIETTNLRSMENLLVKLEENGKKVQRELSPLYHQGALNYYLKGLKSRYSSKKTQVAEMGDLQYYVWILKNGKL